MEENKYYTPEIDEFFVGFECELKNSSHDVNFEWEKFKITGVDDAEIGNGNLMDWSFYDSRNAISEKSIRVKFLDREDMMCDGFILQNEDVNRIYSQFLGMYRGHKVTFNFTYAKLTNWMLITITTNNNNGTTIFAGRVKNKSELRKLMKMLQITK